MTVSCKSWLSAEGKFSYRRDGGLVLVSEDDGEDEVPLEGEGGAEDEDPEAPLEPVPVFLGNVLQAVECCRLKVLLHLYIWCWLVVDR